MIQHSNISTARAVARAAILRSLGWIVEITLLDREGIATDLRYISEHNDLVTLYTRFRNEAEPLPHQKAMDAGGFVADCYNRLFPEASHVSIRLVRAGRVK